MSQPYCVWKLNVSRRLSADDLDNCIYLAFQHDENANLANIQRWCDLNHNVFQGSVIVRERVHLFPNWKKFLRYRTRHGFRPVWNLIDSKLERI